MVLFEEIFAAFFNHLTDGFSMSLLMQRIFQFWAFNILAFTGFVIDWYFLITRFRYSDSEVFFLAGVFGLFSEGAISAVFSEPLAVLMFAPLIIYVYGLILTPAMLSIQDRGVKDVRRLFKYALTIPVIYFFSIVPFIVLSSLRTNFPTMFPPENFIPL